MSVVLHLYEWLRLHFIGIAVASLLLLLVAKVIPLFVKNLKIYFAIKNANCYPEQHFLFGHAPEILQDTAKSMVKFSDYALKNRFETLKICLGPMMYQLVCFHPDSIRIVYKSDPKSDDVYYPFLPWLGRGLLTANGKRWQRSRRLLTPAFHYDILRPYVKVYAEAVEETVGLWKEIPKGESVDVFPYMSQLTLDIMLRCTCSYSSNCQLSKSHSSYVSAVYELSNLCNERIFSAHKYFDLIYFFCPDYWRFKKLCRIVHKFSMDAITQRRVKMNEAKRAGQEGPRRKYLDFIDILLEAKDESGVGLTDLEIRAEVDTFMFEGHDTTASGLTWTLYNLATHPEHQQICRRELDAIFDRKDGIDHEDLKSLVHLKYCIKESLRLFPPVAATGRVLAAPTMIDNKLMPKGTAVASTIYAAHHHPEFWENPEDFDPLRFTPERSRGRHSHAFVPFSAGPRNCIGQEFAMNEEKVVLAHILRNFEISLDETKPAVEMNFQVILRPKNGLFLKLKPRERCT